MARCCPCFSRQVGDDQVESDTPTKLRGASHNSIRSGKNEHDLLDMNMRGTENEDSDIGEDGEKWYDPQTEGVDKLEK